MLYDQTSSVQAIHYGVYANAYPPGDPNAYQASEAADDFTVGANGWTVTGFNAIAFRTSRSGVVTNTADVFVYPDANGLPGTSPVCSSPASVNNALAYNADLTLAQIVLDESCELPPGTYWVGLAFDVTTFGTESEWSMSIPPSGNPGALRSPPANSPYDCPEWENANTCLFDGDLAPFDLAFQVIGTDGIAANDGLLLTLTLAPDNGDPSQCGTATELSVNRGDQVNFCYTVTNHTGRDLDYQALSDSLAGQLFPLRRQDLPNRAHLQFNRIVEAGTAENGIINASWTAQDGIDDYVFDDTGTSRFSDIAASGTAMDVGAEGTVDISMPFSFAFYGVTTNQLTVSNNGALYVGPLGLGNYLDAANLALPAPNLRAPALLPLWDDFDATSGGVYYATLGTAPNRRFVVEWANRPHQDGSLNTDTATFEVIIDEATGTFSYEYEDFDYTAYGSHLPDPVDCNGGACATIGVQQDASRATQYSFDTAALNDGRSIAWAWSPATHAFTATASATLDVGSPIIAVTPASLAASAVSGGTATAALTVENDGNRSLQWTLGNAPGAVREHLPGVPSDMQPIAADQFRRAADSAISRPVPAARPGVGPAAVTAPLDALTAQVPAFAASFFDGAYATFDAADPSTLAYVSPLAGFVLGGSFAHNDFTQQYLLMYDDVDTKVNSLVSIDTSTGSVSVVASPLHNDERIPLNALRWDYSTQTMYAAGIRGDNMASYLYTIDLTSGEETLVGTSQGVAIESLAFDRGGHLYGLDLAGDRIVAMDKTNGDWAPVLSIGYDVSGVQDMDFDPATNLLWYVAYNAFIGSRVYAIDVAAPSITQIGELGDNAEFSAFSIANPASTCDDPRNIPWLSLTSTSGTVDSGSSAHIGVTFDAAGLADGVYDASLCFHSNDSRRGYLVAVPVQLTVGAGADSIFGDGFDRLPANPNIVRSGYLGVDVPATADGAFINWSTGKICTSNVLVCSGEVYDFQVLLKAFAGANILYFQWPDDIGLGDTGGVGAIDDQFGYVYSVLQSGATIGQDSTFFTQVSGVGMQADWYGVDGYLGFRFDCPNANGASITCYGYLHVKTTSGDTGFPVTLIDYAYDKSGAPITIPSP